MQLALEVWHGGFSLSFVILSSYFFSATGDMTVMNCQLKAITIHTAARDIPNACCVSHFGSGIFFFVCKFLRSKCTSKIIWHDHNSNGLWSHWCICFSQIFIQTKCSICSVRSRLQVNKPTQFFSLLGPEIKKALNQRRAEWNVHVSDETWGFQGSFMWLDVNIFRFLFAEGKWTTTENIYNAKFRVRRAFLLGAEGRLGFRVHVIPKL